MMKKRNLILIALFLVIIMFGVFAVLYYFKPTTFNNIKTGSENFISSIFPFVKNTVSPGGNGIPPFNISNSNQPGDINAKRETLFKISSMPVAGYGVFMKERYAQINAPEIPIAEDATNTPPGAVVEPSAPATEFAPALRYIDKITGNFYQTFADKIEEQKITTTEVPWVYESLVGDKGNSAIIRYLNQDNKNIETFAGILPKDIFGADTASSTEINGSFLPENIKDASLSPDGSSVFYLFESDNNAIGITATVYGDKKNQIFNSPFTEWLSQWPNERMITLTTKPSYGAPGFMYAIDPTNKKFSKILGGINGLTTLTSPSGKLVLYNNNDLSLSVYNIDNKDSISTGIKTMSEKCVWNLTSTIFYCSVPKDISGSEYPDPWYRGEISFSDNIWKINAENGSTTLLAEPSSFSGGEEIDGTKMSLDENESFLFLVNKKDSFLWGLALK